VQVGDVLLIRPGAKVPVDAEVLEGDSEVDESTVTGESLPVHKGLGDGPVGATINTVGSLRARAVAVGADTALAQVVKLVQEAQNSKAPAQRLADAPRHGSCSSPSWAARPPSPFGSFSPAPARRMRCSSRSPW
jgi:Cu2+-exporting ATPase